MEGIAPKFFPELYLATALEQQVPEAERESEGLSRFLRNKKRELQQEPAGSMGLYAMPQPTPLPRPDVPLSSTASLKALSIEAQAQRGRSEQSAATTDDKRAATESERPQKRRGAPTALPATARSVDAQDKRGVMAPTEHAMTTKPAEIARSGVESAHTGTAISAARFVAGSLPSEKMPWPQQTDNTQPRWRSDRGDIRQSAVFAPASDITLSRHTDNTHTDNTDEDIFIGGDVGLSEKRVQAGPTPFTPQESALTPEKKEAIRHPLPVNTTVEADAADSARNVNTLKQGQGNTEINWSFRSDISHVAPSAKVVIRHGESGQSELEYQVFPSDRQVRQVMETLNQHTTLPGVTINAEQDAPRHFSGHQHDGGTQNAYDQEEDELS